jgi:TonB-linked SusC/RagA family outer membrane protein
MQMNQTIQTPATVYYGTPVDLYRDNLFATSNINTWIIEPQVGYTRRIGNGKLDVLIGTTFQDNTQNSVGQDAYGFSTDAQIPNIAAATNVVIYGSNSSDYRYNAVFGRINYNWQDKYLLNLTARRDGSSRFGPGNQFGNFGAMGIAWIFSKANFIRNKLSFLSFGKLRASYGSTGNDQIPDYQFLSTYSNYSSSNTYQGVNGLYPSRIANPFFGWELVKKLEGGIELGFLKDRIILNANYYRNRTGNQLVGQPLPSMVGFTTIQANLPAVVQNSGVELALNTTNINSKKFSWTSSFNLSIPRNKLISFPNLASSNYSNLFAIGKSLFTQSLYHYIEVDPQTGIYTFQDINKDGVINSKDRQFLKEISQRYFGGLQNSFSYKGWQLDVFFQFVKQTGRSYITSFSIPGFYNTNQPVYVLNRWVNPGNHTDVQRYLQGASTALTAWGNATSSDYIIVDASFIRLKNVALSYSLPSSWQKKAYLQNAKIYIQCQNLFTITSYKGLDPESQGLGLPPLRIVITGIQIGF